MLRGLLILLTILALAASILFIHHQQLVVAISTPGCVDIPPTPDYLSTGSAYDAVAAINSARQEEHLQQLHLPANFYRLDPPQQQFILLNLERTDRGLHPLRMDTNLAHMAWAYSKQLRDLNFFSHTSPIGGTFSDRINSNPAIANHYSEAAENIAGNPVPGVGPMYEYMYDDVTENCGHRHNILNPALTLVGINWIRGSIYGSMSAQEFLTSAPWNPYTGATAQAIAPQLTISVTASGQDAILQCLALAHNNVAVVRVTWFLDHIDKPLHVGASWTLDTHHLTPGKHTLFAYAIDGEQNYGMASYRLTLKPLPQPHPLLSPPSARPSPEQ